MQREMLPRITVSTIIHAPMDKVWKYWTEPAHIQQWNHASDDWHCPHAVNDLRVGGEFSYTMAAKDGSFEFDFSGVYESVIEHEEITYSLGDVRKVFISFYEDEAGTEVIETFEAEEENSLSLQQQGWQSILNNFKSYVESN